MRYVFRALALMLALGFAFNLGIAQKSLKELPDGAADDLTKQGDRESHQGADNPMQGNRSNAPGRFGGPDPYGAEGFEAFINKAEMKFNDPQWQLKLDLQPPKRIVVQRPDGSAKEYWYVLFRVINDNTREIKRTVLPEPYGDQVDVNNPKTSLKVEDQSTGEREGVPADAHLNFELHVFTRDIEKNPWDTEWPDDPENAVLTPEGLEQRRANMKQVHRPVSDQFVLQQIAAEEGLYEWMGNSDFINEPVTMLHPLSAFQRQIGLAHELTAPQYNGPRCLEYRTIVISEGERSEAVRYVAIYSDNTFAGFYGTEDPLPDGATLITDTSDAMWGKLTIPRYRAGDCVDRFGNPLAANDPGYLDARAAGAGDGESSYGMLGANHPAVGKPVTIPHVRTYKAGDRVLFSFDTGIKHAEHPNTNYTLSGKIVRAGDPNFGDAEELDSGSEMFGGSVVGKPVKQIDKRGRALVCYPVTYQPGDVLTQAEWDIYSRRIGKALLSRYTGIEDIVGRPLRADDPVVGMNKIKLGYFIGDAENRQPESIERGIDTGRRGPKGEVLLEPSADFMTGRLYDPRKISPEDFMRDPDGTFTTNRVAPLPSNHGLNPGEDYIYAPLGAAGDDAVPVPAFDRYGAWKDYIHERSESRIPLYDEEGNLVRDMQDQLLYQKEYEYEYVYMYEYEQIAQDDNGFRAPSQGRRYEMVTQDVKFGVVPQKIKETAADGTVTEKTVQVAQPLQRLVFEDRDVSVPELVKGYMHTDASGKVSYLTANEYEAATGSAPDASVTEVPLVKTKTEKQKVVVGTLAEGESAAEGRTAESWEEAEARVVAAGGRVETRQVLRYVHNFRRDQARSPGPDDYSETPAQDNGADLSKLSKTYSRWTVPPPLVVNQGRGDYEVITRFADKIGPGTRWDDKDAPRFMTRLISEMWGVAIFEGVGRDWDFANVYVRGLRGHVTSDGLTKDTTVTQLPSPLDITAKESRAFFKPRMVGQEWVYRARYERLGDEFENFQDLIRRTRSFWYLETEGERAEYELDN